jgi:hypothetical protein
MSRTLTLHIGLPKTGTTAIQSAMANSRKALLQQGACYPPSPAGTSHAVLPLAVQMRGNPAAWRREVTVKGLAAPPRLENFWQTFDADMRGLPRRARHIIMSSERFGLLLNNHEALVALRNVLAPHFDALRIVVYLRRQDAHATSAYSQSLRMGVLQEPSLARPGTRYYTFYDYAALLDKWSAVFGQDAIVPRLFERGSLLNGDVVSDFIAVCGLDETALRGVAGRVRNQSINLQGQSLLLAVGRLMEESSGGKVGGKQWEVYSAMVSSLFPGQGWRPSRAESDAFMAEYAESNEAVRRTWFPGRATLFDTNDADLPGTAQELDAAPGWDITGKLLIHLLRRLAESDSEARRLEAEIALAEGNRAKAVRLLQNAVKLNGENTKAQLALARHWAEADQADGTVRARPGNDAPSDLPRPIKQGGE